MVCLDEDCNRDTIARGLCTMHYQRAKSIDELPPKLTKDMHKKREVRFCSMDDCERKHWGKGLCSMHLQRGWTTPEYNSWMQMKFRCYNPKYEHSKDYMGRGITVCEQWLSDFKQFLKDMGKKPSPKHTIDRINNDGNYEPDNCKWSTKREQASNRRNNTSYGYPGIRKTKSGKWNAYICVNYKQHSLGVYETLEEAIEARKTGELEFSE